MHILGEGHGCPMVGVNYCPLAAMIGKNRSLDIVSENKKGKIALMNRGVGSYQKLGALSRRNGECCKGFAARFQTIGPSAKNRIRTLESDFEFLVVSEGTDPSSVTPADNLGPNIFKSAAAVAKFVAGEAAKFGADFGEGL